MRVFLLMLGMMLAGCSERDVAERLVEPLRESRPSTGATYRAIQVTQSAHAMARDQKSRTHDHCSRNPPTTNTVSIEMRRSMGSRQVWGYRESRTFRRANDGSVEVVIESQAEERSDRGRQTHAFRFIEPDTWIRDPDSVYWYRTGAASFDQIQSLGLASLQTFLNAGSGWKREEYQWVVGGSELRCEPEDSSDALWLARFKSRVDPLEARFEHDSGERRREILLVWSLDSGETLRVDAVEEWSYDSVPTIEPPADEDRVNVLRDRSAFQVRTHVQRLADAGLVTQGNQ